MASSITDDVLSLFSASPEDEVGAPRTISFRIPTGRLAFVDALASQAEVSRSHMLNELIRFGISAVMANLPDEIRASVEEDLAERVERLSIEGEL